MIRPILSAPQNIFLNELDTKFRAYVGGFGSGKTYVGCLDLLNFCIKHPGVRQGYFGTTYGSIRDIFWPTLDEAAESLGMRIDIHSTNKEIDVYYYGRYYGTIICRSMDNPKTIVGFKVARALVDEIDTLAIHKAQEAWNKIIARLRLKITGVVNGIGVTTTPEGFKFVYEQFAHEPTQSYSMVQASTYENQRHLPDDYISSLYETYPQQLIQAYLMGEFVNLTSGTVYGEFDRVLNNTDRVWDGREPLYIGMDFNVGKMAAVVHVKDAGGPRAVDEIVNGYDTPAMIRIIKDKFRDANIRIYPDASGDNRKSVNASKTDLSLLRQSGFVVIAKKQNPFVKDRVLAMNQMFCNNQGLRRYLVNVKRCPNYADCLEQQVWNESGEPDKTQDKDHPNDAGGYFIVHDYPVVKPQVRKTGLVI